MFENSRRHIPAFCPLCVSRCGCEAVVEDGRLVTIESPIRLARSPLGLANSIRTGWLYVDLQFVNPLDRIQRVPKQTI
jgi:anaerobic selenocysteine-containing dehydrogenase